MNLYVNYDKDLGFTVNTYTHPNGFNSTDGEDFIIDFLLGRNASCSVGSVLNVIDSGHLKGLNRDIETGFQEIHNAINEFGGIAHITIEEVAAAA